MATLEAHLFYSYPSVYTHGNFNGQFYFLKGELNLASNALELLFLDKHF